MHQSLVSEPQEMIECVPSSGSGKQEVLSDDALVKRAQGGDSLAYAELCRRHHAMIYRSVYRITKNREDTEDALQESCMRGFMHVDQFDGRSAFSTWLTRIAINSALMTLRKRRRSNETFLEDHSPTGTWTLPEIQEPSKNPEDRLLEQERQHIVRQAVKRLPPRLRKVVEIRHLHDCSVDEIAKLAGISTAATKSRLLRARNTLSKPLGRLYRDSDWRKARAC